MLEWIAELERAKRCCMVAGRKAICWGRDTVSTVIVEFEDGTVESVRMTSVRFLDSARFFGEYIWRETDED
jgi:hypothetical protein